MKDTMRLDRLLANMGHGTRKQVKELLKSGAVTIDGEVVRDGSLHVNPRRRCVAVEGQVVEFRPYIYLMMNKPQGLVSSTEDPDSQTVVDLLRPEYARYRPFPVGRLDKDVEGLLILTNDGQLTHNLLSPRKSIPKRYFARVEGVVTHEDVRRFASGINLGDFTTLPASLEILRAGSRSEVEVVIYEGKYHQVKRMFAAIGKPVMYLKRIAMGSLRLDSNLLPGQYRELSLAEITLLKSEQGRRSDSQ